MGHPQEAKPIITASQRRSLGGKILPGVLEKVNAYTRKTQNLSSRRIDYSRNKGKNTLS
jgi:pantothenate kinase type III